MDLFTHMLIGFLLGYSAAFTLTGYSEWLLLLTVVMAMLPDFDVFLFLIPKRYRSRVRGLKHRGISHTLVFIVVASVVISFIFNMLVRTDILTGFILALTGGLSHIGADAMTSFAFPYLAPFSWKEHSADIDGAVSWYMVPFSLVSIITMWSMRAYNIPFEYFTMMVAFVFLAIVTHYLTRLGVKLYAERVVFKGKGAKVNPTPKLLSFYVVMHRSVRGVGINEYEFTRLPRSGKTPERRYFEIDNIFSDGGGISGPENVYDAVVASSKVLAGKKFESISNIAATPVEDGKGGWTLFWFDWNDWSPVGKGTPGTMVTLQAGKPLAAEPAVRRVEW